MSRYEPKPRIHPYIASVGKKIYMYGGSSSHYDTPSSFVEVFDQETRTWTQQPTTNPPLDEMRSRGACCSLPSGDIYFYGGFGEEELCDCFYKLTDTQFEWINLLLGGDNNLRPLKKAGCQMVVFHRSKIALYGGQTFRSLLSSLEQLSRTVSVGGDWRITNELHVFDTPTGKHSYLCYWYYEPLI